MNSMLSDELPDHWGDGEPGDESIPSHVYVSEVKVTPHNEPNDIMYPATLRPTRWLPVIHGQEQNGCHTGKQMII